MGVSWTREQQQVIDLRKRNILVSAAAGSGKTAVLVERIIKMITEGEHPVDIDRLLVVTFTNAAAAEMRERIGAAIEKALEEHPDSEHLQRQLTLIHNAQITTIDSFCLYVIRNHFHEIDLEPDFRIGDEGELKLLKEDVLRGVLESNYEQMTPEFAAFAKGYVSGKSDAKVAEMILSLYEFSMSYPWPMEWLTSGICGYEISDVQEMAEAPWMQPLVLHLRSVLADLVKKLRIAHVLTREEDGPNIYEKVISSDLAKFEGLAACENFLELYEKLTAVTYDRLPSSRGFSGDAGKLSRVKELRDQVKDTVKKINKQYFFASPEVMCGQVRRAEPMAKELVRLAIAFSEAFAAEKRRKNLVDFHDLEHFALEILVDAKTKQARAAAEEFRDMYEEIMIDEYQDSNHVQETLLRAISREERGAYNLFMVGDVKQSIYRFRLARPELFLEKYDTYQETGDLCRIDLAKNFRSRIQVVDAVNDVFSRIMSREIGGIAYDDKAALYPGAVYPAQEDPAYGSELLLIRKPEKGEREESGIGEQHAEGAGVLVDYDNVRQLEALAIAARIKQLKGSLQVMEKSAGELRPVRYSDMVILLRTTSGWDEEFKKILEQQGIPVYITSKTGYFGALEVQELLQFLRVLDNPRQDIPLFGVMQSVFGGFTQEEIAQIRSGGEGHSRKRMTLYEALKEVAQSGRTVEEGEEISAGESAGEEAELSQKADTFLQRIGHYRDLTPFTSIRDLLQRILDDYDYLNYVTALPAGSKRRANVEMLLTKASAFEKTSYFGLFHFIRYMEQLEKYDVDYGEADTLDENADVVRIMSIHKSKGLEFPVVFVSGLSKRFNMQDANQSLIVDMDLGVAVDYVDSVRRIKNKTLRRTVLSAKMKEDNLAEELRVLYVALTRAREKLILTAVLDKADEKWELAQMTGQERLTYLDFCEAGSYMDFLLPILPQTGIAVKTLRTEDLAVEELREQLRMGDRREQLRLIACGETTLTGDPEENERKLMYLRERFAYQYPHPGLQKLYTKTTVSELKIAAMAEKDEAAFHTFEEKEVVPYIPGFRREQEKVSGAVRGNAFHRTMELLDFTYLFTESGLFTGCPNNYEEYRRGLDKNRLQNRLEEFLQRETISLRLTEEYAKAVSLPKILNFLEQELAYRMWRAQEQGLLYREQPFVLGIDAKRLDPDLPEGEKVLIQGIIDVFFIEDGEIVLLDYKTDVIDSLEALWNRYNVQIQYYEEALTKLMQMPVKERILYSFYLEKYE